MTPTLAVAIPHADWAPGRPQALARVLDALGPVAEPDRLYVYANRDTRGEWWGHIAQWAAAQPCTHFLQVQDDLALMPGYLAVVRAMVEAVPDRIIGLHSVHQEIPQFARGGIRWITTADGLTGPQYVLPLEGPDSLAELRKWRDGGGLRPGWNITEDTLIGVWALATGRRIWHPIPALADHMGRLTHGGPPSTYGNDAAQRQSPPVLWNAHGYPFTRAELSTVDFWRPTRVPHLGRLYGMTPYLVAKWVEDMDRDRLVAIMEDVPRGEVVEYAAVGDVRAASAFVLVMGCGGAVSDAAGALGHDAAVETQRTESEPDDHGEDGGAYDVGLDAADAWADAETEDVQMVRTPHDARAPREATADVVADVASGGGVCDLVDGVRVACASGAEYRIQLPGDGGAILDEPCGYSAPPCPSGAACYTSAGTLVTWGVCP